MAFGARVCAACGSVAAVERHHLVPRGSGGDGKRTVWLCSVCHGAVHGMVRSPDHRALTRLGSEAARAQVRLDRAAAHAAPLRPVIEQAHARGTTSLRGLARALEAAGAMTPYGNAVWTATQVQRVLTILRDLSHTG